MRYICCIVVLLLSLPLGNLSAQDVLALAPGVRVRVTAPVPDCEPREARFCPRGQEIGTLVSIDSLTIVMNDAKGIRRELPRGPYTRLDLSAGSGACGGHRGENLCELVYLVTVPGGALVGMIVGGVLGAEHWHTVEPPIRVGLTPSGPGRWAFGFSAHF